MIKKFDEFVKINESGDTHRGQYMLGRLAARKKKIEDFSSKSDVDMHAYKANNRKWSKDFDQGYEDELKNDHTSIAMNYDTCKMKDNDKIAKKFIDFFERHDGGALIQLAVDYLSGNETGKKNDNPVPELITIFEDEVLGYKCNSDSKKAIEDAFNQWLYYNGDIFGV